MIVDKNCNRQILGALIKHPQFLSETDKYALTIDDFSAPLEKYIFTAISGLYANGARAINVIDIENYLNSSPVAKTTFEKQNGIEYLQDVLDFCSEDNFDYYYNKLKKFNLLNALQKMGVDISEFYCEDLVKKEAFEINDKFEKLTIPDILDSIKKKIYQVEHSYLQQDSTEVESIAEGIDDFITDVVEDYSIGLPLQGEIFNEVVSGAQLGTLTIRSMPSGTGKALPNSTIIPTPNGWRRVDEIKPGDYLFDVFGKPTKVLNVYPQGEKEVYQVFFRSGRVAECCSEHLWSYYKKPHDKTLVTKTLEEIIQEGSQTRYKNFNEWSYRVPIVSSTNLPRKAYSVDPYVMGFILGSENFEHGVSLLNTFFKEKQLCNNRQIEEALKKYPELWICNNFEKYIPEEYLYGSEQQRLQLLRGLMDTSGSFILSSGKVSFTTLSPLLKTNFMALLASLGILFRLYSKKKANGQITYRIDLIIPNYIKEELFSLPNKKELVKQFLITQPRIQKGDFKTDPIVKIEKTRRKEEMTCFLVDNKEHLFVAGDTWWVTHNTRQSVGDACLLAFPYRYDNSEAKWVLTGCNEKVLFIATEQSFKEIRKMVLAYLSGINEDKFKYASFTPEEKIRIQQSTEIIKNFKDNFYIVRMPNPTIELIKSIIRENCLLYDVEYVFYDYIFIGPALLNEFRGFNLRNDKNLSSDIVFPWISGVSKWNKYNEVLLIWEANGQLSRKTKVVREPVSKKRIW